MKRHGYNERLFLGTLAAGGTLDILIPPSINLIIYGALTETSIPQLYLAGFLPGFILAFLMILTIIGACLWRPEWGGRPSKTDWPTRIRSLVDLIPPLLIFLVVIGAIYSGLATATESAALGLVFSCILAATRKRLTLGVIKLAMEGCMKITGMTMAILVAAYFLNFVMATIGLNKQFTSAIETLGLGPYQTLGNRHPGAAAAGHLHGNASHDDRDRSDHRSGDVFARLRSGLVRDPGDPAGPDGDDFPAGRDDAVRGSEHQKDRKRQRCLHRLTAFHADAGVS